MIIERVFESERKKDGSKYLSVGDLLREISSLSKETEVMVCMEYDGEPETAYRIRVSSGMHTDGEASVIIESGIRTNR